MTHTYMTTHRRHNDEHWLRFSIGAFTLAGIAIAFRVHWGLGLVSILPFLFLNATLNYYLNARVTLSYLRKDCGIDITWDEAKKYQGYFSPNKTGRWINASHIALLPKAIRRDALFAAIANFDLQHGTPDGSDRKDEGLQKKAFDSDEE